MKIRINRIPRRGFALVVTLSLMVLLTIIALGLLSLSTISLRASSQDIEITKARANARLGMMMAIGKLQAMAGPDQRVTASASLTGSTRNSMWTGVWSTTTTDGSTRPMVAGHENGGYLTDLRNSETSLQNGAWKTNLRLGWLVSGENVSPDSVIDTDPNSIQLVGSASLGGNAVANDDRLVTAPYVKTSLSTKSSGGYAYWVGDESQKARIDLGSPYNNTAPNPASPQDGGLYRLAGAGGADFSDVKADDAKPYSGIHVLSGNTRSKLVSFDTVSLQADGAGSPRSNFHDITTSSNGLLTDVVMGGLQKDLTSVIESSADIAPLAGVSGSGMTLDRKILTPTNYAKTGPSFARLRNWYRIKDQISGGALDATLSTPIYADTSPGLTGGFHKLSSPLPDITSSVQAVLPLMTDCRLSFDFSLDTTRAEGRAIRTHLYPRVTLWNPYNITLKGQRYFVGCALPQITGFKVATPSGSMSNSEGIPSTDNRWFPGISTDSEGAYGANTVYFELAPIDLAPGEAVIFSPDLNASSGTKLAGQAVKYDGSRVSSNVMSAAVPSGAGNFYVDSNRKVNASVDPTRRPDYGFTGDVNNAFNGAPTMTLKRVAGSGSVTTNDLNGSRAETLQMIHFSHSGNKQAYWWYVFHNSKHPVNGGESFQDYNLNPQRYPPRLWFLEGRMHWLDETDEQSSIGNTFGASAGSAFYNNPVIGNYNVRATMVHRDPFSYYNGWTKYSPGGYMLPWSSPRLNDPRMDSPYRNSKSHGSPFSPAAMLSAASSFAMFDLPKKGMTPFSLANFQHAQLGVHSWQPTYVIGNSIAEPRSDRDKTVNLSFFNLKEKAWGDNFARERPGNWDGILQGNGSETLIYDMSYQVNQQLWDRYFLSTMPYNGGKVSWDTGTPLPNSRLHLINGNLSDDDKQVLLGDKSFDAATNFLMNKGAFNVNSTRVEAWRAMLSTLNHLERPTKSGDSMTATFSRLLFPGTTDTPASTYAGGTWSGARKLSASEIDALAVKMVEIVKERGPFLGLADFVNRRLATATTNDISDPSICGPLQAAIERSGINALLQKAGDRTATAAGGANANNDAGSAMPDWKAFYPYKNFGAPGYLSQADVLQTIGQSLTTRGDTFVIRCYGDSRDASNKILAKAWCEVVVQRIPEYISASPIDRPSNKNGNNPIESARLGAGLANGADFTTRPNEALLPINRKFGRRFVIQSFRWLNASEI